MARDAKTDRRIRALVLVFSVIALVMVVATGFVAWQTSRSDDLIEDSVSG